MRALVDINVVLDVLADREPFVEQAVIVFQLIESGVVDGCLAAHTVTTLHYLLAKHSTKARTRKALDDLLHLFAVVPVDEDRLRHALAMGWTDFEDAVQAACAEKAEADFIVTRDKRGFKKSVVRAATPAEFVALVT